MMELNSENVTKLLYPSAAFQSSTSSSIDASDQAESAQLKPHSWTTSTLNPKNRVDSLTEPLNAMWRVDGSAGMGTQFYTVPIFLGRPVPMRIDTFIPERKDIPADLQEILDIGPAFYTRDNRVARLGIARYIVRVLDRWSRQVPDFEALYNSLPFGSRIVLQNVEREIRSVKVQILQTHFLERQLLSIESLQAMWNIPSDSWPEATDISNIALVEQLHDSVSLVKYAGQTRIMKSLTSSPKYLYHELKVLLTMSPHRCIISRPSHLIVKRCNFGSKLAVVGFILDYYSGGALRDALSWRRTHRCLQLQDQVEWSIQLTEALIHIRDNGIMYCDLRLDNIVLNGNDDGIVMIDFEARGVGTFLSAPEVTYLEYINFLANEPNDYMAQSERDHFKRLHEIVTSGRSLSQSGETYRNPRHGYCHSWLCIGEDEREAAQVCMLGKVIWGIFEGVGSPEKGLLVEHLREDVLEYPEWRSTPLAIRDLINACCTSWRPYKKFPLAKTGQLVRLRNSDGAETREQVRDAAGRWWKTELQNAEKFIAQRAGAASTLISTRPKLEEVLLFLKSFEKAL